MSSLKPSIIPPCTMLSAAPGLMIWLPTSAATQILLIFTLLAASTVTSATSAKYPRWLKWNATPMAVPLGYVFLPQPDFSATSCSTPFMRSALTPGIPPPRPPCAGACCGARPAQRTGADAQRLRRLQQRIVGHEALRKLRRPNGSRRHGALALAVSDEMIPPRHHFPRCVQPGLQILEPARTVVVVCHVVFARPQQLHRNPGLLGDEGRL